MELRAKNLELRAQNLEFRNMNSPSILSYQNIGINIISQSVYKHSNLLNIRKSAY